MAYRNDLDALEARHAALEAEVAERTRQRDEVARMVEEARAREHNASVARDWANGGPARRRRRNINIGVAIGVVVVLGLGLVRLATRPSDRELRVKAAIAKFEKFTEQICACKDKACSKRVVEELTKWAEATAKNNDWYKDPPDQATVKRMEVVGRRFADCMTKAEQLETQNRYEAERY